MKHEQATAILKSHIKSKDLCDFKGLDIHYDRFWSGHYEDEITLDGDNECLYFAGDVSFNISDGSIIDVEINEIVFEYLNKYGETIEKYT